MPGVSDTRQLITRDKLKYQSSNSSYECCDRNPFSVGDKVYLKPVDGRCDITWSGPHRITKLLSNVSVIINNDGVARHVSHLRLIPGQEKSSDETYVRLPVMETSESDEDDNLNIVQVYRRGEHDRPNEEPRPSGSTNVDFPVLCRSSQKKVVPVRLQDYVLS